MSIATASDLQRAGGFLGRALPHAVDGAHQLADVIACPGAVFELHQAGRVVGAFSLEVSEEGGRRVLRCLAAGAEPGAGVLSSIVAFVDREAREHVRAHAIACDTCRPGLIRRLCRMGFNIAGRAGRGVTLERAV